ncbi:High affinity cGMP-specific 3',5'-cyclic phosphodiesterase 9A [Anabarilius grahami]|uniref:Phosphodiesterase n=1 Tax=Anabarilius grahami TaxID=495550 RepID=A0A3N0Z2F3_ANAGA|nr:High affinity cGMP-specific 3',5'-cyclic phosphodiesterase 9A [Anabarilius grahami]
MATKIIYFTVNGRPEQAEFPIDCPAQDVKDLFRAAAEAGPHDILKLYNTKGNIINISPQLAPNSPHSCYKLEVVAADCNSELLGSELGVALGFDLSSMEKRLQSLEKRILAEAVETPAIVYEMKRQVESFREKLESVEHLSWLGLFKDMSESTHKPSPFYHKRTLRKTREECEHVREKFLQMSSLEVSEEVRQYLKTPTFDNWQWEDAEIMVLLQVMYTDLDFISTFNIELDVLQQFLYEVYRRYNNIPFHNFKHCFCVTQMMYGLIWLTDLRSKIDSIDLLIMLTSAVCHDLDHTGYNNAYQINARTELALRYNDISPLENHHCAVAFEILEKLMMIMIKVSDISNEARPMDVAEPWLDCLLQEFFNQSDMEKLEGLPVTPFMDRDKVTKPSSQTGFIRFVLFPLFIELANLFPCLEQHIIDPVRKALDYYTEMEKALEREKQNRTQSEKVVKPSTSKEPEAHSEPGGTKPVDL